jgi:hypothetical protein
MTGATFIDTRLADTVEDCGALCRDVGDGCQSFAYNAEVKECRRFGTKFEDDLRDLAGFVRVPTFNKSC